jgi:ferritin-like metal-binding protein YciE
MEKQMEHFFEFSLRRLFNAENQNYDHLAVVVDKAISQSLKEAISHHRRETANQIDRLKNIAGMLDFDLTKTKVGEAEGLKEKGKEIVKGLATLAFTSKSEAMEGAIDESSEMMKHFVNTPLLDFVLIAGSQPIEMWEVAVYEVLCLIAEETGIKGVADLLKASLSEEKHMRDLLLQLQKKELQAHRAA